MTLNNDPITRTYADDDGLARIGAALVHACTADPLLSQRLPRRVLDALELHAADQICADTSAEYPVGSPYHQHRDAGRVLAYQRSHR